MCFHNKPVRNDEERGYNAEFLAPALEDGDKIIFDECGRCSPQMNGKGGTDYHSHHFRLVEPQYGPFELLVKHGGGQERITLGYDYTRIRELIESLPSSDARYLMLHALYNLHRDTQRKTKDTVDAEWRKAAIDKKIKTRRLPARGFTKVWIEQ